MSKLKTNKPVAIVGAGPVGLAAAAHLASHNIPFKVFESSSQVGANLLDWGHVRVFTPWKYVADLISVKLLQETNWRMPNGDLLPTGEEIVREYLKPLSQHPKMEGNIYLDAKVIAVSRKKISKIHSQSREDYPFVIKVLVKGIETTYEASAVIDASGTWQTHNPIGAGGVFATGELENAEKISYRIPDIKGEDLNRYANKSVAVVGSGHSAINSLIDLADIKLDYPGTSLHWILQTPDLSKIYGGKDADELKARGALGTKIEALVNQKALTIHTPVFIEKIIQNVEKINLEGESGAEHWTLDNLDEIIANTGGRPDFSFLREIRYQADPVVESVPDLAELIDPNKHSCGTVRPHGELELKQPEPNFYVVGIKSYGRAPTFLMPTGYEQVRSIAAWLAGDIEAARRVELNLPETGVCNSDFSTGETCCATSSESDEATGASCCGPTTNKHEAEIESTRLKLSAELNEKQKSIRKDETSVATSCCASTAETVTKIKQPSISCCG